jgi:hypothetical protein
MSEIERLWADHLTREFPSIRGDEVAGIDLLLLDADIAEHITAFLDHGGRLAPVRRTSLDALARQARAAEQSLTGPARDHFARLARVADLVVRTANPRVPAG